MPGRGEKMTDAHRAAISAGLRAAADRRRAEARTRKLKLGRLTIVWAGR